MDAGQLHVDAKVNTLSLSKLSIVRGLRGLCVLSLMVAMTTSADALPDPVAAVWQGRSVCAVLREDVDVRIFRCVFPPGVGHERHFHPRHFGYALSGGTMRITSGAGTREVTLETGSSFSSEGLDWHEVVNIGDSVVSYIMIEPK